MEPPAHAAPGTRVVVRGLASARASQYNGRVGVVKAWDESKLRATVHLDGTVQLSKDGHSEKVEECVLPLKASNFEALSRGLEVASDDPLVQNEPVDDGPVASGDVSLHLQNRLAGAAIAASTTTPAHKPSKDRGLNFANMFSKPGALSEREPDVVWKGGALPRVFFDIAVDGEHFGRVIMELWPHKTPKSAENFRCLCTGERGVSKHTRKRLHYKGSCFHIVMDGLALMGGDILDKGGKGGESAFGYDYEDRSCVAEGAPMHDRPGVIAMGIPGDKWKVDPDDPTPKDQQRDWPSFSSRFSIFLTHEPGFNGKLPVIGVVLEGLDVLKRVAESTPVNDRKRAQVPVTIDDCGELQPDP